MGCASNCFKCVLNAFNVLWAIGSVFFIAAAALNIGHAPILPICVMFLIGVLGVVASMLGCCGMCNENIKLTKAYAILIGISLLIQIIALIVLSFTNVAQDYAVDEISEHWEKELKAPGGMTIPQKEYKCCGKDDPSDYITILHREYPASCFPRQFVNQSALFTTGCIAAATTHYEHAFKHWLGGSWGSIIFTIIMLLLSIYLVIRFRKKQSSRRYNYDQCAMK